MGKMTVMTTKEIRTITGPGFGKSSRPLDAPRITDVIYRLRQHIATLTGHDFECEIQVDPEWKPCTCGRG
jgi:hypothetical protein